MPKSVSANNICETHHAVDRATYCEVEIFGEATFQSKKLAGIDTLLFRKPVLRIWFSYYGGKIIHENNSRKLTVNLPQSKTISGVSQVAELMWHTTKPD